MNETYDPPPDPMMPRPVRDSQSEMNEIVLPNDTNPLGALLGGRREWFWPTARWQGARAT